MTRRTNAASPWRISAQRGDPTSLSRSCAIAMVVEPQRLHERDRGCRDTSSDLELLT